MEATRIVAWELDGVHVTIIGRGFDDTRNNELVALANEVELIDGVAKLTGTTFDEISVGSLRPAMATVPFMASPADRQVVWVSGIGVIRELIIAVADASTELTPER